MATKTKVALAAIAALVVAGIVWTASGDGPPVPQGVHAPGREIASGGAASRAARTEPAPVAAQAASSGGVEITVRDFDGRPLADAVAEVRTRGDGSAAVISTEPPAPPAGSGTTGANGIVRIDGLDAPAEFVATVRAPGRGLASRAFRVADTSAPAQIEVVLLAACRLTGRVLDEDGAAVPGAVVVVRAPSDVTAGRVLADGTGRYVVEGLPSGLVAAMAGRDGDVLAYDAIDARARSARVRLPFKGELDLVVLASARIAGTVRDSVTGRPLAGARVSVFSNAVQMRGGPAVSGADGRYVVTDLCDAVVDAAEVELAGYERTPVQDDRARPRHFAIRRGETRTLDLRVTPLPAGTPSPAAGGAVEGRVLGPEGAPVPGARVGPVAADAAGAFRIDGARPGVETTWEVETPGFATAFLTATPPPAGSVVRRDVQIGRGARVRGTVTRGDGAPAPEGTSLRLQVIPEDVPTAPGAPRRFLWVEAAALRDGSYACVLPWAGRGRFRAIATAPGFPVAYGALVDIAPGADLVADVVLSEPVTIFGRVVDDADGAPVAGARIEIDGEVVAVAGSDGAFSARGARPPTVTSAASVVAPSYLPWRSRRFDAWSPDAAVLVRLERERTIEGIVVWPDARAAVGAVVWARRDGRRTTADSAGRFAIRGLPATTQTVCADHPDGGRAEIAGGAAGTTDLRIVLASGAAIAGRVLDADGRGVPAAGLFAAPEGRHEPVLRGLTAADGSFVLPGADASLAYSLNVVPPAKATPEFPEPARYRPTPVLGIRPGGAALEIRLDEGRSIDGVVADAAGAPLADVEIEAVPVAGGPARRATSDAAGRFRIGGLEDAAYALRPSNAESLRIAELRGGDEVRAGTSGVRLTGVAAATLRCVVVDELGAPVRDALVEVETGGEPLRERTGTDGSFTLRGLRPGAVVVHVDQRGFVPESVREVVPGGDAARIVLRRGLEMRGRVVREGGTGVRVSLLFRHPTERRLCRNAWTDDDGRFRMTGFPDAQYEVLVSVGGKEIVSAGVHAPGTGAELELRIP